MSQVLTRHKDKKLRNDPHSRFLSSRRVAKSLRISHKDVKRLIKDGELVAVDEVVRGVFRIERIEFDRYKQER